MQIINVQQYNNLVDNAIFKFKRYYNGIDLDGLTCCIYKDSNKIIAGLDDTLVKTSTDELITIEWTISDEFTQEKTKYQVVFEDENKVYLSTIGHVMPRESIDIKDVNHTTYEHSLGLLEQWQNNMVGLRQTCDGILAETKVLANETSQAVSNFNEVIEDVESIIAQAQISIKNADSAIVAAQNVVTNKVGISNTIKGPSYAYSNEHTDQIIAEKILAMTIDTAEVFPTQTHSNQIFYKIV